MPIRAQLGVGVSGLVSKDANVVTLLLAACSSKDSRRHRNNLDDPASGRIQAPPDAKVTKTSARIEQPPQHGVSYLSCTTHRHSQLSSCTLRDFFGKAISLTRLLPMLLA